MQDRNILSNRKTLYFWQIKLQSWKFDKNFKYIYHTIFILLYNSNKNINEINLKLWRREKIFLNTLFDKRNYLITKNYPGSNFILKTHCRLKGLSNKTETFLKKAYITLSLHSIKFLAEIYLVIFMLRKMLGYR